MQIQRASSRNSRFANVPSNAPGTGQTPKGAAASGSVLQKVKAGQTLFAEGEDASAVFEIVQGILKLYKLLPDGRRQIMGFVSTDRLIGSSDDDTFLYTAEAVTDVSLRRYSRSQFERLLDEVPGFARRVLDSRLQDLHSAQDQMLLLGRKTAVERIATFIVHLGTFTRLPTDGARVHVPMPRADIADYLGLTVETVSRTLTKLKQDRVISLPEAVEVKIIDRNRLEELAAGEALEAA